MRALKMLLLVMALATVSAAQSAASDSTQTGVAIVSSRFDAGLNSPGQQTGTDRDGRILSTPGPYNDGPADQYKATVLVKNNGTKTTRAINWSVVYFDVDKQKEVKRYKVRSKQEISSGETKTLTKYVPPGRLPGTVQLRVLIDSVEYTDGSVWQR